MSNKAALVTGGASGIGAATVETLVAAGWRVAVADTNIDSLSDQLAANPDGLLAFRVDVSDPASAHTACDGVVEKWGQIDLLVNCAGINRHSPLEDFPLEDWNQVLNVNLTGTLLFMQAAAKHMMKVGKGAIVNISSINGARGNPDRSAYAATKAAVDSLTKSGALAWAQRGIRVNAVAPGFTRTPLVQVYIDRGNLDEAQLTGATPMRRMAEPAEIAAAVVFLGSDAASFITGQTLYVDGGFMAEYGIPSSYQAGN